MNSKKWIPRTTVGLRVALGPLLIAGEQCRWSAVALSATVIAAWLSEIFDGVLARQRQTDSATLRLCETLALARQIRRRWQQQGTLGLASTVLLICGLALCNSSSAQAQTLQHVTYVGGTALQGNGLHGKVSVHSVNAVEFLGPVSLSIPYDRLVSFESKIHQQSACRPVHRRALAPGRSMAGDTPAFARIPRLRRAHTGHPPGNVQR